MAPPPVADGIGNFGLGWEIDPYIDASSLVLLSTPALDLGTRRRAAVSVVGRLLVPWQKMVMRLSRCRRHQPES